MSFIEEWNLPVIALHVSVTSVASPLPLEEADAHLYGLVPQKIVSSDS